MRIKYIKDIFTRKYEEKPISQFVCENISKDDYEFGAIESLERGFDHLKDAFGHLLDVLASSDRISLDDILKIVHYLPKRGQLPLPKGRGLKSDLQRQLVDQKTNKEIKNCFAI